MEVARRVQGALANRPERHFNHFNQLYRAGTYLYNNRQNLIEGMRYAGRIARQGYQSFTRRNSRPRNYRGGFSGGGGGGFRRINRRSFRRRRPVRRFRRRRFSSRRFRRRGGFARSVKRVALNSEPWVLETYKDFRKFSCPSNTSLAAGYDVGLGGTINITPSAPPGFPFALGDIYAFFNRKFAVTDTNVNCEMSSKLYLTLRNQSNFGCFLKIYYCKCPISTSVTSRETIDENLNLIFGAGGLSTTATQHTDLTDFVGVQNFVKITHRRTIQFMPGETKTFSLGTGWKGPRNLSRQIYKTRNNLTRSIVFQFTGFPLHDTADETKIGTAAISVDCSSFLKMKGRLVDIRPSSSTSGSRAVTLTNLEGQQYQAGAQAMEDS